MMNKLKSIFILSVLLTTMWGCNDNILYSNPENGNGEELAVEFNFEWPGDVASRSFDDIPPKTKFTNNDVIHVIGTFHTKALNEDNTYTYGIESRYGILTYNGITRNWEASQEGNQLTWPSIATDGSFYAYYISESNGVLTKYNEPITFSLSDITPQSDPLYASPTEVIPYGHAVKLQFDHLCTYLTFEDLEPMVADKYFFTTEKVLDPETESEKIFNNAFSLSLVKNDGTQVPGLSEHPALKFDFCQKKTEAFKDSIFIEGNAVRHESIDDAGKEKIIAKASFFLEPGRYETFTLNYPSIAPKTYEYLSYDYNKIPDNVGDVEYKKTEPNLEAGRTYTLTITKSPGITIATPPDAGGWDDDGDYEDNIDVPDFLEAIYNGKEYKKDGKTILEETAEGTKLLCNVDFKNFSYEKFNQLAFSPDVIEGKVFDGNYHYIKNLGSPLFRNNYGTIKNVGIENVKFSATSYEADDTKEDRSRHGALCMRNRQAATISNVRLINVEMDMTIDYQNEEDDGGEVHNIGGLVGSNTGMINDVYLKGDFNIIIKGEGVDAQVIAGGLIGQNAGGGSLYSVSLLDDNFQMNITNKCQGSLGAYLLGGIAGQSTGEINDIILSNITIDSKESSGVSSYIGGMIGQLDTSESSASVKSCIVSGRVEAGTSAPSDIAGESCIGGMMGSVKKALVQGCRHAISVIASTDAKEGTTYATGGAFGRIYSGDDFENLIVYGSRLQAPTGSSSVSENHVGNFAGIAPIGQSWENYAQKNIMLRTFTQDNIGTYK